MKKIMLAAVIILLLAKLPVHLSSNANYAIDASTPKECFQGLGA